ncbi:nuclear transport factor 2 family protein [Streptomyces sp. NPDC051567]|uniref:nuclear transport factor 2 family protein n=1 Tax=Streptomyces sp. NPDC051567 TaxID=3365660 RepID=UPI0037A11B70
MTQRVDLATVMDRLAIDEVVTGYAVAVGDGDWAAYRALFAPGGRADYRSAGGVEGPVGEVAEWLARALEPFPVRQHLIVNRLVRLADAGGSPGDSAEVRADFLNPAGPAGPEDTGPQGAPAVPTLVTAGRCDFTLARTAHDGWRLTRVTVRETWRSRPLQDGCSPGRA